MPHRDAERILSGLQKPGQVEGLIHHPALYAGASGIKAGVADPFAVQEKLIYSRGGGADPGRDKSASDVKIASENRCGREIEREQRILLYYRIAVSHNSAGEYQIVRIGEILKNLLVRRIELHAGESRACRVRL